MNEDPITLRANFFKPHEYVRIKPKKTAGDVRYINNASMKVGLDGQSSVQIGDIQFATVERMLVDWNITQTKKNAITGEITEIPLVLDPRNKAAALEELDGTYFEYIFVEITARNPPMSQQEQADFLTPATNGLAASPQLSLVPSSNGN